MLPVVILPDAELVVLDYLRPRLATPWPTLQLGTLVPAHRPFLQVRRIGGAVETPGVDAPRVDLVAYHTGGDHDRMRLARDAWAYLKAAASDRAGTGVVTYVATTMGPRQMPDPTDNTKRVAMFTVDLLTRPV